MITQQELIEEYRILLNVLFSEKKPYIAFSTFLLHKKKGATLKELLNIKVGQGGSSKGNKFPKSWKITEQQINEAKKLFEDGVPILELSKRYGVSRTYFYSHGIRSIQKAKVKKT